MERLLSPLNEGFLVVISAPSGGGKTTLNHELMTRFPKQARRSISTTTRPPRDTEIHSQDYYFVSDQDFDQMIEKDELAEWAQVHKHRYGVEKKNIDQSLNNKELLFLTIDVQGAATIRKKYPNRSISIFVAPPDFDVLETRLRKRGTENEDDIKNRLNNARKEIARADEFDYKVLNDSLERAALEIESIIHQVLLERKICSEITSST